MTILASNLWFLFQDNDFCLGKLLKTYPLKKKPSQLSPQENRRLGKLIRDNQTLASICQQMNRPESEIIDEIVILIRTGCLITKTHLQHLVGVSDKILKYLKSNLTDEDLANLNNISEVKAKYATDTRITEQMLTLVLNYMKIRQFLRSINIPYFDVDENRLVNGSALLEAKAIEKVNSKPEQSQPKPMNPGSQEVAGKFSSNQNRQSSQSASQFSDLLGEDEDDFAAAVANYDSTMELKPLQSSQKTNQSVDLKTFAVKQPAKMPTAQTKTTTTETTTTSTTKQPVATAAVAKKRPAVSSKYQVQYFSDSESDSESADNNEEPKNKRALPQWLTTKKGSATSTANGQSNPIRKKSFF